ncbi:MAG: glycosyltransferase [Turicibacter sp.]|nr:glycosyltransferase [Turicibacter sp.]
MIKNIVTIVDQYQHEQIDFLQYIDKVYLHLESILSDNEKKNLISIKNDYQKYKNLQVAEFYIDRLLKYKLSLSGPYKYKTNENSTTRGMDMVDVIITTYNRKSFLIDAVESVLSQSYTNIRIIIMDDASTDGTQMLVSEKYSSNSNIVYHRNDSNCGPSKNRLYAYETYSKGEYVIFMDDDDYFIDNEYLANVMKRYEIDSDLAFIAADVIIDDCVDHNLNLFQLNYPTRIPCKEYFMNFQLRYAKPASTFTAVFNKKILDKVNFSNMNTVNDSSIYLRSLLGGDAGFISKIVGIYRVHGNNITFNCSCDFICENIMEKIKLANLAKEDLHLTNEEYKKWVVEQCRLTSRYYLNNSNPSLLQSIKLMRWLKYNINDIYFDLRKEMFKLIRYNQFKQIKKKFGLSRLN